MTFRIPYIDQCAHYRALKPEIDEAIARVANSGRYIGGEELERFEDGLARFIGSPHVVGVGSGYDAMFLTLKVMGIGPVHKVRVDRYTHKSTWAAVVALGATPDETHWKPDLRLATHMNGAMQDFPHKLDMPLVEDACQALGARDTLGNAAGTVGDAGCFSFHPLKVLSCMGTGGAVATKHWWLAERIRELRNHGGNEGMAYYGVNSRLDTIQAAILNAKLPHLPRFIRRRREIAALYDAKLKIRGKPRQPQSNQAFDVYSSYVIEGGPFLLRSLRAEGIEAFSHIRSDRVSLPIYPEMPDEHIEEVADAVNRHAGTDNRA